MAKKKSSKRTYREFKQGIFKPVNHKKCLNKTDVVYRSFLEARLMKLLDKNSNVIEWSSEQVIIPYKHPQKSKMEGKPVYARYFVDFFIHLKVGDKSVKLIAEVKPEKQTSKPTLHGNKKQSTIIYENLQWAINSAKWEAAKKYAEQKNMEFMIITEKTIDMFEGK